jgi:hypothetical protein
MQAIQQIGTIAWTDDEIKASIPAFLEVYKQIPISDNRGGMKSPHLFAAWFMLGKLNPKYVIESGIWKGQGTWLIEKTLPETQVFSIDPNLGNREFVSGRVKYYERDFFEIDWSVISDKENTVLFFDDHQNAVERIIKGKELGFRHFIFEDNYPARQGDCYSLKKAFQHAGYKEATAGTGLISRLKQMVKPNKRTVLPNARDAERLRNMLDIYYEFPPVYKKDKTRWGDDWEEENYPTPAPLYRAPVLEDLQVFSEEADSYTWICYAKIK